MKTGKKSLSATPGRKPVKKSGFNRLIQSVKNVRIGPKLTKVISGIGAAGLSVAAIKFVPWKTVGSALYRGLLRVEESFHALQTSEARTSM